MKKIIKFILCHAYSFLLYIFSMYLIIYNWGKLYELAPIYSYLLVLLLGMIIGFGLYRKVSQLLYRMNNK